ncbi:MAG: hypothetical protein JWL81_348 [Verrucomicrobiales bacterium]|nr:hypothetical protein [Verrucomicrobiales bacterium]
MKPLLLSTGLVLPAFAALVLSLGACVPTARAQAGPSLTGTPLVIPYKPLLPAMDGAYQVGMMETHSLAAAGTDSWLSFYSYRDPVNNSDSLPRERFTLRLVRAQGSSPDPIQISDISNFGSHIQTVGGEGGAWALWTSPTGVKAWWISGQTGQPVGAPILLPDSLGITSFRAAGDGKTAWIVWDAFFGHKVVTLTTTDGAPRIRGHSHTNPGNVINANGLRLAASQGKLLMLIPVIENTSYILRMANEDALVLAAPTPWPHAGSRSSDSLCDIISYGSGWMALWTEVVTPFVSGRIVYGQELDAAGNAIPGKPPQMLFIEPMLNYNAWHGVVSGAGMGAIVTANNVYDTGGNLTCSGFAMILRPGTAPQVIGGAGTLPLGMASVSYSNPNLLPPMAASLSADRLDLMTAHGQPSEYFHETLRSHSVTTPPSGWPAPQVEVTRATGLQEEPALAWTAGAAVVAWQQKSLPATGPELRQRRYLVDSQSPDFILTNPGGPSLSSPDLATNQNRILMVARQEDLSDPYAPSDDVAGIITENGVAISFVFKIAAGPGSYRAACATPYWDGFCVVWREEEMRAPYQYEARIRMNVLDRNGVPEIPGGLTIATAGSELSAPAVSFNPPYIKVVWKRQLASGTAVEYSQVQKVSEGVFYSSIPAFAFPAAYSTSSPDVIAHGSGFIVTARGDRAEQQDEIMAAFLDNNYFLPPVPMNAPSLGAGRSREPALANLTPGATAAFWLKHQTGNRPSDAVWMSTTTGSTPPNFAAPVRILSGIFDRDTLVAKGDGKGRVLLAVKSRAPGDEGLKIFLLAPGVNGLPTLTLLPATTNPAAAAANGPALPGPVLGWKANVLFPASAATVQASPDLQNWSPAAGNLTGDATEAIFLTPPPAGGGGTGFFRLKAAYSGE